MTACVNKKSKRVAAVVTASLVGALSIGAPAVALAANGGIEMLAADWATDAKVSKATDGKGGSVSDPLKATFEAGSGKYLVPTQVANQHVTTDIDEDFEIVYKAATPGSGYTGLNDTWEYKSDALGLEKFTYSKDNGLTPEQAAAYFSGKLTTIKGKAIAVKADGYTVKVTSKADRKSVSTLFRVADPAAKTYTAIQYNAEDPTDSSDKTLTFTGKALWSSDKSKTTLAFVDDEGTVVTPSSVAITKIDGTSVTATALKDAGSYVATFDGNVVPFTVEKLDLSTAVLGVKDPSAANSASAFLKQLTVNSVDEDDSVGGADSKGDSKGDVFGLTVTKVVNPAGGASFATAQGTYSVTVSAGDDNANVSGSATVSYDILGTDLAKSDTTVLKYGKSEVTKGNASTVTPGAVNVDLSAGESFDASKLSISYVSGGATRTLSGDDLVVSYANEDGTKALEASDLKQDGTYLVTVKVKAFEDFYNDNSFTGGSLSLEVKCEGASIAHSDVAFYFDGEIAGARKAVTYDGTDQLEKLSAKVLDANGKELVEGTDYALEVTYKGKKVEEAVDADEVNAYTVTVKPITFKFENGTPETFALTIKKVQLNVLIPSTIDMKDAANDETGEIKTEDEKNEFYVPYTGKAVAIPALKYEVKDSKGNCAYVDLDSSLYSVVNVKYMGEVVKEAIKADKTNPYTVKVVLTDDASKNYELNDSTFSFTIREYGHFKDVDSAEWYSVPVEKAYEEGYINGISGTNLFAPKADITRADAVCILFNMAGGKIGNSDFSYNENTGYETGFSDVDGHAYFAKALAWAKASGVANGSNGQFRPYDKITREEFASLLANFAKSKGDYEAVDADKVLGSATDYTAWAKENVAWAKANGIMGNNGAALDGTGKITRAQVAAMAVNYQPENLTGFVRGPEGTMVDPETLPKN